MIITVNVKAADGATKAIQVTIPDPSPAGTLPRPTGAGYVAIESLNVGLDLRAAFTKNLSGLTLTLPNGTFTGPNWDSNNGVFSAPAGCTGLVGSGKGTVIGFAPGFTGQTPPTTGTNPMHTLQANNVGGKFELGQLMFQGNAGHLHGAARVRTNTAPCNVHDIWLDDCSPGNYWSPPGETFGVNCWHCEGGVTMDRIDADGHNNAASLIGFNNSNNIVIHDMNLRNNPWGMPTFWECTNVETHNVVSNGGHAGINHENVGGVVKHYNLQLYPNRNWTTTGANASAMHATMQSSMSAYVASRVEFHDTLVDTGLKAGCFMLMSGKNYGGTGAQLQNPAFFHVYKTINGVEQELSMVDTSVSGGASPDVNKYWYLYR